MIAYLVKLIYPNVSPDPINCQVHRKLGCSHIDGYLCDMRTCNIKEVVSITPYTVTQEDYYDFQ